MRIYFWDRGLRRYLKRLYNKVEKETYQDMFNIAIVENLVKGFSVERLRLLKEKEAKWTAKDEEKGGPGAKKVYDAMKELRDNITREENLIKGADNRVAESQEGVKVRSGKLKFIKEYLDGRFEAKIPQNIQKELERLKVI